MGVRLSGSEVLLTVLFSRARRTVTTMGKWRSIPTGRWSSVLALE